MAERVQGGTANGLAGVRFAVFPNDECQWIVFSPHWEEEARYGPPMYFSLHVSINTKWIEDARINYDECICIYCPCPHFFSWKMSG
jgi:hypothetical protein